MSVCVGEVSVASSGKPTRSNYLLMKRSVDVVIMYFLCNEEVKGFCKTIFFTVIDFHSNYTTMVNFENI